MTRPGRRKRYVMLAAARELDPPEKKEAVRLLLQMYPDLDPKKMVWVGKALIFRTDQRTLPGIKLSLEIRVGDATLRPARASGSISKLKRAVQSTAEGRWPSSSRKSTSRMPSKGS